jgi:type II secretory pathway pseudopilin PulG
VRINPYESPQGGQSPERKTGGLKSTLFGCFAIMGILALLIALLLPAVRYSSEPARRSQCRNNLKQIALALLSYEDVHHALPPAYTVDANGKPLHSWRTLILPFMERQDLYEKIDLSKTWDDPANQAAFETSVPAYRCPSVVCPMTQTTYLAVVAPGGCFRPTEPRKLAEITDDPDLTLMVMEVAAERAVHWMSPTDATEAEMVNLGDLAKLPHPGAAQAVTVSGSVLIVSATWKPDKLRALVSIAGDDDAIAGAD